MKGLKNLWKLTNGGIFAIVISNCYYCLLICYSTLVKLFNFLLYFFLLCYTIIWWIKMYNWMLLLYRPIEGPCVCVMEGRRKEEAGSCVVSGWDYFSHSGCWHEALAYVPGAWSACVRSVLSSNWMTVINSVATSPHPGCGWPNPSPPPHLSPAATPPCLVYACQNQCM